jgi:RND family efflux transporter MFP subunit
MKKTGIAILLMIALVSLNGCSGDGEASPATTTVKVTPVKVEKLQPTNFKNYLKVTGDVAARNHVKIIVEEGGTLKKVYKDKGSYVKAGELLAELENTIIKSGYEQAEAALQQAELDYNSKSKLYEKRAISENEFLYAKYNLQSAKAAYNLAKSRYEKLFIKAPLNGLVNERYYDLGAYASPMTPIFEFIDNAEMRIRAGIAERFMDDIEVGTPVHITFDAFPDLEIDARVTYVSKSINPKNRTFDIEVIIPNPGKKLAPAMVANLQILRKEHKNQIVVPLDALIESESGWYVYVRDGNVARRVKINYLDIDQDKVLVEGLQPGQELIVVGHRDLADGDTINVVN